VVVICSVGVVGETGESGGARGNEKLWQLRGVGDSRGGIGEGRGGSARSGKRSRPTLRGRRGRGFSCVCAFGTGLSGGEGRREELRKEGSGIGAREVFAVEAAKCAVICSKDGGDGDRGTGLPFLQAADFGGKPSLNAEGSFDAGSLKSTCSTHDSRCISSSRDSGSSKPNDSKSATGDMRPGDGKE
jgi:hypothetical protein